MTDTITMQAGPYSAHIQRTSGIWTIVMTLNGETYLNMSVKNLRLIFDIVAAVVSE